MTTHTPVLGSREYPCCRKRSIRKPTEAGVYSKRCPRCLVYWVLHVEPSTVGARLGTPVLRVRWDVK